MKNIERAFWGFIVGDALGVPVEFCVRDTYEVNDMLGFGSWNVPAGTWSDDSAMTFVTMAHLVQQTSLDELKRDFCNWKYRGYWTHDQTPSFDVGATISEIISRWEFDGLHEKAMTFEKSNGNGALMRMLPIALKTYKLDDDAIFQTVATYAELTHGHIRSTLCCVHYTYTVHALLNGLDIRNSLKHANQRLMPHFKKYPDEIIHFNRILQVKTLTRMDIKSTGYVLHTLESVYWSLINGESYYDTVLKAIHLGEDTDTIGAITGSLAGLYYEKLDIPKAWIEMLPRKDEIAQLIEQFIEQLKIN